jgi:hypothetical protein
MCHPPDDSGRIENIEGELLRMRSRTARLEASESRLIDQSGWVLTVMCVVAIAVAAVKLLETQRVPDRPAAPAIAIASAVPRRVWIIHQRDDLGRITDVFECAAAPRELGNLFLALETVDGRRLVIDLPWSYVSPEGEVFRAP